jgi:hypothetical protein
MAQEPADPPGAAFEQRVLSKLALPLPLAAALLWVLAFGLFALIAPLVGVQVMAWDRELRVPIDEGAWTAAVHSLLLSFGFVGVHYTITKYGADIAALAPVSSSRNADELRRLWQTTVSDALPRARILGWASATFGVFLAGTIAFGVARSTSWREAALHFTWFWIFSPMMTAALARSAYFTLLGLRLVSRLGRTETQVDLLDLDPLSVFSRIALRNALGWILAMTIFTLYFVNIPAQSLVSAYPFMAGVVVLSVAALVMPYRSVHESIRREKTVELERLRIGIRSCRDEIGSGSPEAIAATIQLPGLLAYEARIQDVREWPVDTSTLLRFGLYLGIPLGSWLGGAIVERMLSAAID